MLAIAMVVLDSREGEFKKKKNCKNKIKKKKNTRRGSQKGKMF